MPIDGSSPMTATNTYSSKAACDADLKAMVSKAEGMLGSDVRINASCKQTASTVKGSQRANSSEPSKHIVTAPSSINLTCRGYWGLMKTNVSFVFNIDLPNKRFSGTRDALHEINGEVGGKDALLALLFKDATGMHYTAWIDRNTGSFKVDLSNDKLYLMNNITGQCEKFAGRKF